MGNCLKGGVSIDDVSLITDNTQQGDQVSGPPPTYQVSLYYLLPLLLISPTLRTPTNLLSNRRLYSPCQFIIQLHARHLDMCPN